MPKAVTLKEACRNSAGLGQKLRGTLSVTNPRARIIVGRYVSVFSIGRIWIVGVYSLTLLVILAKAQDS